MSLLAVRIVLDNAAGSCSSGGVHASRPATHGNRLPESGSTTCIRSQPSRVTRQSLQVSRFHLRKSPMTTSRSCSTHDGPGQVLRHRDPIPPGGRAPGREIGDRDRLARVDARHDESGELFGDVRGVLGPRADHRAGRVRAVGGWIGDHRLDPRLEVRSSLQSRRQVLLECQIRPSGDDGVNHRLAVLVELFSDPIYLAGPPTDELRHRRSLPVARGPPCPSRPCSSAPRRTCPANRASLTAPGGAGLDRVNPPRAPPGSGRRRGRSHGFVQIDHPTQHCSGSSSPPPDPIAPAENPPRITHGPDRALGPRPTAVVHRRRGPAGPR
jgi:hypothetical protein